MCSSNEIRLCSSFSVIHVSLNIESDFEKDTTLLFFFSLVESRYEYAHNIYEIYFSS